MAMAGERKRAIDDDRTELASQASRSGARLLLRTLIYWAAAAVPLAVLMGAYEQAQDTARRTAREAAHASRVAMARRVVVGDLSTARSDLGLFATGVGGDYVRSPGPRQKAALTRDLSAFVASRLWCRGVAVTRASGGPASPTDRSPCDWVAEPAAALGRGETLLERAQPAGEGGPVLCLAIPLGEGGDGHRWALVAEIEPRGLFSDLAASGGDGLFLQDERGRWILRPGPTTGPLEGRTVDLPSWRGSASGAWRLFAPRAEHDRQRAQPQPRDSAIAILILAAGGAGAFALARAIEARRRAEQETRRQLSWFQVVGDNAPSAIFLKGADGRY